MEELVKKIIGAEQGNFSNYVKTFQQNYGSRTTFEELNNENLRENLWECLFKYVSSDAQSSTHHDCLSTLRILSRDRTNLDTVMSKERIETILDAACLKSVEQTVRNDSYTSVTIESLKLLCNLLFNSKKVQQIMSSCLPSLIARVKKYSPKVPHEVMLFDIRIIFLVTALNVSTRQTVKDLNGDAILIKSLQSISSKYKSDDVAIELQDTMLVCEILKALFNLYVNADDNDSQTGEKNTILVQTLYKFLILKCPDKEDELHSNIANMLTILPYKYYGILTPSASKTCNCVFLDRDMTAVATLVRFLENRLGCTDNLIGNLTPILTSFIRLVRAEKHVRRYVRLQVLPPLKDVMKRPEEGHTLRAKLCKLLTTPLTEVRDLVAEFLFILCKENVGRMVKYTGYGNAAGMFANKGLLGHARDQCNYSSESEDSDTEEYIMHREQINPVTGCFEHPKPNPLEGMTEEQKEYEALQLVGLVDKLQRRGIVQPCRIGEDGKPKPIEHVLELQGELSKQQISLQDSDSD